VEEPLSLPKVASDISGYRSAQAPSGMTLRALQWIEMAGHNIENVKLHLASPFSVQGHVVMEAHEAAIAPEPPRLISHAGRVRRKSGAAFRTMLFDQDGAITADANRDSSFGFKSVYADSRIAPPTAPASYYLDSVHVGETVSRQPRCRYRPARFRSRSSRRPGLW
jgi:hypothetical protein